MRRVPIAISLAAAIISSTVMFSAGPAQAATAYDVGVIPSVRSCPAGSEAIVIRMDDEDDNNENSRGGYHGAIFSDHNGTEFFFCRIDGRVLRSYQPPGFSARPYAVLKLGSFCPNGSFEFFRRFDNEDDSNNNWSFGNIAPNVSDSNTLLRFCLFNSGSSMTFFPNLGFSYGVFSTFIEQFAPSGFVYTDDEDDSNNNGYGVPAGLGPIARAIVTDGANTRLNIVNVG
jgi:hypothetical protein